MTLSVLFTGLGDQSFFVITVIFFFYTLPFYGNSREGFWLKDYSKWLKVFIFVFEFRRLILVSIIARIIKEIRKGFWNWIFTMVLHLNVREENLHFNR